MFEFEVAYLPIGVPTFHLETARAEVQKSAVLLRQLAEEPDLQGVRMEMPEDLLLNAEAVDAFLQGKHPGLVIVQNATFASSAYIARVLCKTDVPILIWTLREPAADGGRLKLNSLTGAYSAANLIRNSGDRALFHVLGAAEEEKVRRDLLAVLRAARCCAALRGKTVAAVGHTPDGFGFGRAGDADLLGRFGLYQKCIESRELIRAAEKVPGEEVCRLVQEADHAFPGFSNIPETNRAGYAALLCAYRTFVEENGIAALSSRCWPDYFTEYGTPVCTVLSVLNDLGIPAACETDTYGAVSMLIGFELTGKPVFFGDPASADAEENTLTFWHCGMAAPGLASEAEGPCAGLHCNRKIGPTMEFGCRGGGPVTVFRIGRDRKGFRFFLGTGTALDRPRQYHGTSLVVRWDTAVEKMIHDSVLSGWEPHFAVFYGERAAEIEALAELYAVPLERY